MDRKNQFTKTPYLVLFIVLISVGVGTAYAVNITLGGTVDITQTLNMMGNKITNLGTPTTTTDATTKAYVDAAVPNVYQSESSHMVSAGGFLGTVEFCDQGDAVLSCGFSTANSIDMEFTDSFPSEEESIEGCEFGAFNTGLDSKTVHTYAICLDALPAHVP